MNEGNGNNEFKMKLVDALYSAYKEKYDELVKEHDISILRCHTERGERNVRKKFQAKLEELVEEFINDIKTLCGNRFKVERKGDAVLLISGGYVKREFKLKKG